MRSSLLATILALTAAVAAQDQGAPAQDYTFRTAPLNARGVESLADLRGTPTLIEFWGVR